MTSLCSAIGSKLSHLASAATKAAGLAAVSAVLYNLATRTSLVGQCGISSFGTGSYLTFKGISDIAHGEFKKGIKKTVPGIAMMTCGALIAVSEFTLKAEPIPPLPTVSAHLGPGEHKGALIHPVPSIAQAALANVFAGAALWAAQKINPHANLCDQPPSEAELSLKIAEEKGSLFAQEVRSHLASQGKISRVSSNSGVYLIQDKDEKPIAVFKPDDEHSLGPCNPGYPERRLPHPTHEDIRHHEMRSNYQGKTSHRQHLAKTLDHPTIAPLPEGMIVEIESDCFVDLKAEKECSIPRAQAKKGYLQQWIQKSQPLVSSHRIAVEINRNSPESEYPPEIFTQFTEYPILNQIPLQEFQKLCIMNILLYNQDGHTGNFLYFQHDDGTVHVKPIDMDAILPWKLTDLVSFSSLPRANEDFTQEALDYIDHLDPDFVYDLVEREQLSEQAPTNAKTLAIVLQEFSQAGLTLQDIHQFVASPTPDAPSPLWNMMIEAKQKALDNLAKVKTLPPDIKDKILHFEWVRKMVWENKHPEIPEASLKAYLSYRGGAEEKKVNKILDRLYWKHFDRLLQSYLDQS